MPLMRVIKRIDIFYSEYLLPWCQSQVWGEKSLAELTGAALKFGTSAATSNTAAESWYLSISWLRVIPRLHYGNFQETNVDDLSTFGLVFAAESVEIPANFAVTGMGIRTTLWDTFKEPVAEWDLDRAWQPLNSVLSVLSCLS